MAESGTYVIVNEVAGTVIDINMEDGRTITGWERNNNADNQRWTLENANNGSMEIRSVQTGAYLNLDGPPVPGTRIMAGGPFGFDVKKSENIPETFNIFFPSSPFVVTLAGNGDPSLGTPLVLDLPNGGPHQAWKLVRA